MKRGFLKAAAVTFAAQCANLPAAHAGFEIDPSLQVALNNARHQASGSASSQSASSSAAPVAASAMVGGAIPGDAVMSTPLAAPSEAWNTKLQGFARNEPLRQALSHTVPAGGQLVVNGTLPDKRVSWDGGSADSRMTVARKMLADADIEGRFDGSNLIVGSLPAVSQASGEAAPVAPTKEIWIIRQGYPIGQELKGWAKRAGWNVVWGLQRDVIAPTTTTFTGDFASAAAEVVRTLAENGALIHAQLFDGNHTLVVQGPGVAPQ
ncbi:hypothetical protein FAZ69_08240 [Trinickia terrae]|uniref:Toxin co-regulated pilus biosynthesis protein Q C-terminal domain-containing protein n=1 Tax=Trinickia terrae TaxID=2571161 RepID=A0A4V5PN61_9BURK|nr:TcpQ domain-containing protein [Trinickia terrae]TKC90130.1 hypothetical protein FAZ69_08240 [Trinickia terrae]